MGARLRRMHSRMFAGDSDRRTRPHIITLGPSSWITRREKTCVAVGQDHSDAAFLLIQVRPCNTGPRTIASPSFEVRTNAPVTTVSHEVIRKLRFVMCKRGDD
jgi:hypothetical protein